MFLNTSKQWKGEFEKLRQIVLDSDIALTEDFKWMHPCYTLNGKNVVLIHGFKAYCALLFHKGALLKDPMDILVQQTQNVQAARQIHFTSLEQILTLEPILKTYLQAAAAVEKAGLKVAFKTTAEFDMPDEFQARLDRDPALKSAFEALTPGRQRSYLIYFSSAKLTETRVARIEKCLPLIFDGLGLGDKKSLDQKNLDIQNEPYAEG